MASGWKSFPVVPQGVNYWVKTEAHSTGTTAEPLSPQDRDVQGHNTESCAQTLDLGEDTAPLRLSRLVYKRGKDTTLP